jgi:hypothetical protein
MPDGIEVDHDPEIPVRLVQIYLCDLCLDGAGGQCHVPGCALWFKSAPDISIRDWVTVIEPDASAGQAYRVGDRVRVAGTVVGVNDSDSDWVNVEAFGAVFTVEPSGHPDLSPIADVPDSTPLEEWPDPENPVTGRTPGLTPVEAARLAVAEEWQPRVDEAREVVAEMLKVLAEYGEGGEHNDQIVAWRDRAGLEAAQPR